MTTALYHPSTDEQFAAPFIDIDEWRDAPVRHRYVHGGFENNGTRFSFYLPPTEAYEGRFFQHATPVPDSENLAQQRVALDDEDNKIAMAIESGAAFVETNGGGGGMASSQPGMDGTLAAYKANAAAADQFRRVASEMYGEHRAYGYLYGGSGGGFRTMGAAENTSGVWDGYVPYVIGSPMAIPNVFCVRQHAHRLLRDQLDRIVDAYEPGGADPYEGLTPEQADALREVTAMGFPPRSWFDHRTMGLHGFRVLYQGVKAMDPTYFTDFWTVPGYLGADPSSSVHADRVQHAAEVVALVGPREAVDLGLVSEAAVAGPSGGVDNAFADGSNAVAVKLSSAAPEGVQGAELLITAGAAEGAVVVLEGTHGVYALVGHSQPGVLASLQPGDRVVVDNSGILAAQTYHRHQVPPIEAGYDVWDQYRDESGSPLYPQRPFLVGPLFARGAAGTVQSGVFEGNMIVVACLMDKEAFPWQADWYRQLVTRHLGDSVDERFRLWYVDRALHGDSVPEFGTQTVSYLGVLHTALRDLASRVEKGVEPAASTSYEIVDGQIIVPDSAVDRRGVQPVVTLSANGSARAEVGMGEQVSFEASVEVPPGAGEVVSYEWDLDGDGIFEVRTNGPYTAVSSQLQTASYDTPGTRFVTVRIASHRTGTAETVFAQPKNLARVRVVVG